MNRPIARRHAAAALLVLAGLPMVKAQTPYPNKLARIVVGYPAGNTPTKSRNFIKQKVDHLAQVFQTVNVKAK